MKAFSYIRWSSDPQTEGDSLKRQLLVTRSICKTKGWELDESLKPDKALSAYKGTNLEKGSLGIFLNKVEAGQIKTPCVLVVEAFDRLTRTRLRDARKLFERLLENNVSICTAHNGKVYDEDSLENPIDLIISLTELNAAYQYSASIGRRVAAAWSRKKEAARNGEILTRRTPAWIVVDAAGKKMSIDEKKAEVIRWIFDEYLKGKGHFTIARELNKRKVPPFGWGKSWGTTSIRRFLNAVSVMGDYQPCKYIGEGKKRAAEGMPVEKYYPAIMSRAKFYKVQERLKSRFTPRGPRRSVMTLFTGLVKCAKCGSTMVLKAGNVSQFNKKNPWIALVCSTALRGKGCEYRTMQYRPFERGVLTAIATQALQSVHKNNVNAQAEELNAELQDVEAKIKRANDIITGEKDVPMPKSLLKTLSELEMRQESLKTKIEAAPMSEDDDLATIYSEILRGDREPMQKTIENRLKMRSILAQLIQGIELDAKKREAKIIYPTFHMGKKGEMIQWTEALVWNEDAAEGFFKNGKWFDYNDEMIWQ
jgi:DNA invertase Pin-like site-specific DNA recombinase